MLRFAAGCIGMGLAAALIGFVGGGYPWGEAATIVSILCFIFAVPLLACFLAEEHLKRAAAAPGVERRIKPASAPPDRAFASGRTSPRRTAAPAAR
jgi:hypothetical protein